MLVNVLQLSNLKVPNSVVSLLQQSLLWNEMFEPLHSVHR
jgi:hypothetical protein